MKRSFRSRAVNATIAAFLSIALAAVTVYGAGWQSEQPTAQQRLEALDRRLAPIVGRLAETFEDLAYEGDEEMVGAYATIIQEQAAKGYSVVTAAEPDRCFRDYHSALLTGFSLLADAIDSFRVKAPETGSQVNSGWYILSPTGYATLLRNATTCGAVTAEPPRPTTGPVQPPTPVPSGA